MNAGALVTLEPTPGVGSGIIEQHPGLRFMCELELPERHMVHQGMRSAPTVLRDAKYRDQSIADESCFLRSRSKAFQVGRQPDVFLWCRCREVSTAPDL
jgi:hypothetical protein